MVERISIGGQTDPQAEDKDNAEVELASYWGVTLQELFDDLISRLDSDNPQPPDEEWWRLWEGAMVAVMLPWLQNTATASAVATMELTGIGVPLEDIIDGATRFSDSYGFNFVKDITDRTRAQLQRAITNYLQSPDPNFEQLIESISSSFSPVRAEMIAITETTRAHERGLDIYEDGLNALGVDTDRLWHTMRDERVCIICEPNEGRLRDADGWTVSEIPAHPRDRCWTTIVIVKRS